MISLIRNKEIISRYLVETSSGQVITKEPCTIQVPVRYNNIGLANIGSTTTIYGCFCIVFGNEYSVCNINAMVDIIPDLTKQITVNDEQYYEFHFDKGSVVIRTTDLIKTERMLFTVFDEFIFKGNMPWYMGYEDAGKLFDTAGYHAGSRVAESLETIELIISLISRYSGDRTKYLRNILTSYKDTKLSNLAYIPLKNVFYAVTNTLNKLSGNYFNDGVVSSLVIPTTETTDIEKILRA